MLSAVAPRFACESVDDVLGSISGTLMRAHFEEVGHYQDLLIDPDFDRYRQIERDGKLRIHTVRMGYDLVGYGIYIVATNIHYRTVLYGQQATLYMSPWVRKGWTGLRFLRWSEERLREDGCVVVSQHVKSRHDFGAVLVRLGYELQDSIYTKRLDR